MPGRDGVVVCSLVEAEQELQAFKDEVKALGEKIDHINQQARREVHKGTPGFGEIFEEVYYEGNETKWITCFAHIAELKQHRALTMGRVAEAEKRRNAMEALQHFTQGTPNGVTSSKRLASESEFETPNGKRSQGQSWKYCASIMNTMGAPRFRQAVYRIAKNHIAYKGAIEYTHDDLPTKCTSMLKIMLLFNTQYRAEDFQTALCELVRKYNIASLQFFCKDTITECPTACVQRLCLEDYVKDSPNGGGNIIGPRYPFAVSTEVLAEDVIRHESIVNLKFYDGCSTQVCPLANINRKDERNRLVMTLQLRAYYEAQCSEGPEGVPNMSVFCKEEDLPLHDANEYQDVTLQVVFSDKFLAECGQACLRNPVSVAPTQFAVTIQKKQARSFVLQFLTPRHEYNNYRNPDLVDQTQCLVDQMQCLVLQGDNDIADIADTLDELPQDICY